jgi:23S rRNA (adenine2030-N6)-methyltransferase
MNYRHAYHAGNFADVIKHAVFCHILAALAADPSPFFVLDTHAGCGLYSLRAPESQRTEEYKKGIARLWPREAGAEGAVKLARKHGRDARKDKGGKSDEGGRTGKDGADRVRPPGCFDPYLETVAGRNPGGDLRFYPGSPLMAAHFLRDKDRAWISELHKTDHAILDSNIGKDKRFRVFQKDGYQLLRSALPPSERKGVVLIDPPFEKANEFGRLEESLKLAIQRWPQGNFIVWLPVKDRGRAEKFREDMFAAAPKAAMSMVHYKFPEAGATFNESALLLVGNHPAFAEISGVLAKNPLKGYEITIKTNNAKNT